MDTTIVTDNLRQYLRAATTEAHDALDQGMARFDLAEKRDYAAFLIIQLAAREPIETWCAEHAPKELRPPEQAPLIRADLAQLGEPAPSQQNQALPADFAEPLGVAWALGGSSLGNRAMLAHLRKRTAGYWPTSFLADDRMTAFWQSLRPAIERPADTRTARRATASAQAVFARFEAALAAHDPKVAA